MRDLNEECRQRRLSPAFNTPQPAHTPEPTVQPIQEQTGACAYDLFNNTKWQEYTDDADGSAGVLAC
jgi:hypothetical protein